METIRELRGQLEGAQSHADDVLKSLNSCKVGFVQLHCGIHKGSSCCGKSIRTCCKKRKRKIYASQKAACIKGSFWRVDKQNWRTSLAAWTAYLFLLAKSHAIERHAMETQEPCQEEVPEPCHRRAAEGHGGKGGIDILWPMVLEQSIDHSLLIQIKVHLITWQGHGGYRQQRAVAVVGVIITHHERDRLDAFLNQMASNYLSDEHLVLSLEARRLEVDVAGIVIQRAHLCARHSRMHWCFQCVRQLNRLWPTLPTYAGTEAGIGIRAGAESGKVQ
eukprot:scaffold115210_cov16-Tisochrysis_lutea.AAC.1